MCENIGLMGPLNLEECKKLIADSNRDGMTDDDVISLRDQLYVLADVVVAAFADLEQIDQSLFNPKNDLDEWLEGSGEQQ
jgi:hypothetical protein